ncbi:hypothetical protein K438DRAFT_1770040 [Mycena galopus ATCC 62051]|nr:hypothetical protein K438DRAFT_1770040 [Mycena galopus ATCC 62051]
MEHDYSPEVVSRYHRKLAEISLWTESTAQALQNNPDAPPIPRSTPKSRAQISEPTLEAEERARSRDRSERGEHPRETLRWNGVQERDGHARGLGIMMEDEAEVGTPKLAEISRWPESAAQTLKNNTNAPPTLAHSLLALLRSKLKLKSTKRRAQSSESILEEEERPQSRNRDERREHAQSTTRLLTDDIYDFRNGQPLPSQARKISPWTESTAQVLQNNPNVPPPPAHSRALPRSTPKSTSAMPRAQSSKSTPEEEERPQSRDLDERGEHAQSSTRRDRLADFFSALFRSKKSNPMKERAQDSESSAGEEERARERPWSKDRDERWDPAQWSMQANYQWNPDREELVNPKLAEISQWSDSTAQIPQKNFYAPTPAHPSVAIPRSKSKPRAQSRGRNRTPPQPLPTPPPPPPPPPLPIPRLRPRTAPPRGDTYGVYPDLPPQPRLIQTQHPNARAQYVPYPSAMHAHSTTLAPAKTKGPLKRDILGMTEDTTSSQAIRDYLSSKERTKNWVHSRAEPPDQCYSPNIATSIPNEPDFVLPPPSDAGSAHSLPPKMILRYPDGRPDEPIYQLDPDPAPLKRGGSKLRPHESVPHPWYYSPNIAPSIPNEPDFVLPPPSDAGSTHSLLPKMILRYPDGRPDEPIYQLDPDPAPLKRVGSKLRSHESVPHPWYYSPNIAPSIPNGPDFVLSPLSDAGSSQSLPPKMILRRIQAAPVRSQLRLIQTQHPNASAHLPQDQAEQIFVGTGWVLGGCTEEQVNKRSKYCPFKLLGFVTNAPHAPEYGAVAPVLAIVPHVPAHSALPPLKGRNARQSSFSICWMPQGSLEGAVRWFLNGRIILLSASRENESVKEYLRWCTLSEVRSICDAPSAEDARRRRTHHLVRKAPKIAIVPVTTPPAITPTLVWTGLTDAAGEEAKGGDDGCEDGVDEKPEILLEVELISESKLRLNLRTLEYSGAVASVSEEERVLPGYRWKQHESLQLELVRRDDVEVDSIHCYNENATTVRLKRR